MIERRTREDLGSCMMEGEAVEDTGAWDELRMEEVGGKEVRR
jgi:hypothetical protein